MDNRKIIVQVWGITGSGKTAICQLLQEALQAHGIEVTYSNSELTRPRTSEELDTVLNALAEHGTSVEIVERNLIRDRLI